MTSRRILVTSALPYANGHIHIGHLVEYIQTDVWVRFQRMQGNEVLFVCADDTHGTAIMKRARDEGRTPEAVIAEMRESHIVDFAGFDVSFDNYGSTHSDENRELCNTIWAKLQAADLIVTKTVSQLFDAKVGEFLADRYVKGRCPNCNSPDQYGDNCEKCNATYSATELIEPYSTLSNTTPELRDAEHYFIAIEKLHDFLENEWTRAGGNMPEETAQYLLGQFLRTRDDKPKPLRDWDVSRPAPYFGFPIPGTNEKEYWYVWFDAPIGYMASTQQWCQKNGQPFEKWWNDPATEIHHFIGKDITYFHTLFWPAVLKATGYNLPKRVHIHGFLTVNGEKMAKSRGTFIRASTYLKHLDPAYLRYYYASKLTPTISDIDMNLAEVVDKVNSDLVGKVVNLASRTARFAQASGLAKVYPDDGGLFAAGAAVSKEIAEAYEVGDYNKAMRQIMALADAANAYVENNAPWKLAKDPAQAEALQNVCTVALNVFRQIVVYLAPVLPTLARQTGELLNNPIAGWRQAETPLVGTPVAPFAHLMKRIDPKQVDAMVEESKESLPGAPASPGPHNAPPAAPSSAGEAKSKDAKGKDLKKDQNDAGAGKGDASSASGDASSEGAPPAEDPDLSPTLKEEPLLKEIITIDDLMKVDLRVGEILTAEKVAGTDKMVQLSISLGEAKPRTIFAGIAKVYEAASLVGKRVIVVANLAPRKMKFGVSEGMVLAAGAGGQEIYVLRPDDGAKPGHRVH